jgi:glycosyltransferase involved in cell wall biosynthesis
MPAKVLFVSTSTTRGGAEKILYSLAKSLDRRKFSVAGVISLKPLGAYGELLRQEGIPAQSLNLTAASLPNAVFALRRVFQRERPDIVQAFMYQAVQLSRVAKATLSPSFKLVSSHRVNPRTRSSWTLWIDHLLKNQDDLTIAECEASRLFLIEHQEYTAEKVKTIHNGIEATTVMISESERLKKRQSLGVDPDEFLIGTAGRLHKQKDHACLIKALGLLKGRLNLRCVIWGDGPERKALEREIAREDLVKKVSLLGETPDIPSWLSSLDAFILPSLWEGFPSVILEAMAAEIPVIATSVDGVPEMIDEGLNGFLVEPGNPEALAQKIADLCDLPRVRREEIGIAAKSSVLKRFSLSQMVGAYETSYLKVLDAKKDAG